MTPTARASIIASFAVLAVGLAVFIGALVYSRNSAPTQAATLGGPFRLVDQDGRAQTEQILSGKPTLLFFGYTHCPDVCPTTLFELAQVMQALGSDADRVQVVYVSVDPERDTPALLKDYLSSFDARFIGLTGSPEEVANVAREWRAIYRKVPEQNGEYTIDHTAAVYVLDRAAHFTSVLDLGKGPEQAAAALRLRL